VKPLLALLLLVCAFAANAAVPPQFRDEAEEQRLRQLTSELRCVMCQNQSLADSNAMIAQDLRREILQRMREGRSDAEIKQYLVERYTEFVLYQPQVKPATWLLWFGPLLGLAVGALVILRIVRARRGAAASLPPPEDSQEW
jgi:cytochrome c-type biogenesis protein CcmH